MPSAAQFAAFLWALLVWCGRGLWRAGSVGLDLWRRRFSKLLGGLFILLLLGTAVGVRETYRVFALRHGLRELAAQSHHLTEEAVLEQARKRALRLGFMAVLGEDDPLEVAMERDEEGFPLRCIRVHLHQPVDLWGWTALAYPLSFQVREVIIAPRPQVELE